MVDAAQERFRRLYDTHYRAIVGYFLRRLDHTAPAQDLTEDVFLVAWEKLNRVPTGEGELYWLYGVAKRVLANHRRKVTRRWRITSRTGPRDGYTEPVEDQVIRHWEAESVLRALRSIREQDQELIRLAYWEELTHDAIADLVGCSRGAVDVRLHRAVRRLGKELKHSRHLISEEYPLVAPEEKPC